MLPLLVAISFHQISPPRVHAKTRFDGLIDTLPRSRGNSFCTYKYGLVTDEDIEGLARPLKDLWLGGFDAVPALLRHLDDNRATAVGGPWYLRVSDLCRDTISAIVDGSGLAYDLWRVRKDKGAVSKTPLTDAGIDQRLRRDWKKAKTKSESAHLLQLMAESDVEQRGALMTVSYNGVRAFPLAILAAKHPTVLARFYERVRFETEAIQVGKAVFDSQLPRAKKVATFRHAARQKNAAGRVARQYLADITPKPSLRRLRFRATKPSG